MNTYWIYGYAGEISQKRGRTAREAARNSDFAVAVVRDDQGNALTPDLWA